MQKLLTESPVRVQLELELGHTKSKVRVIHNNWIYSASTLILSLNKDKGEICGRVL